MTGFEKKVLLSIAFNNPMPWGAAVSVTLEFLAEDGYLTPGPNYQLTEKGRKKVAEWENMQ